MSGNSTSVHVPGLSNIFLPTYFSYLRTDRNVDKSSKEKLIEFSSLC